MQTAGSPPSFPALPAAPWDATRPRPQGLRPLTQLHPGRPHHKRGQGSFRGTEGGWGILVGPWGLGTPRGC